LRDYYLKIKFVTDIPLKSMIIHVSAAKKSLGSVCVACSANDVTVRLAWTFITKISFPTPETVPILTQLFTSEMLHGVC